MNKIVKIVRIINLKGINTFPVKNCIKIPNIGVRVQINCILIDLRCFKQ